MPKRGYRFVAQVGGDGKKSNEFADAPDEVFAEFLEPDDETKVENTFAVETAPAKDFPAEEKSAERFWQRGILAVVLIGSAAIAAGFFFDFSGAKSGNALIFERIKQTRLTPDGDVYAPTVSPDGQYLVYIKIDGTKHGLRLRQIATGHVLELVPTRPNVNFWSVTFSRDSSYIYYTENKENDLGVLYRIPSLGGQPQKIVEFVNGLTAVSPNETRIAFVRIDKQVGLTSIVTINNDGSNERTIASINTDSLYQSLDWSPNGASILYAVKRHEPKNDLWYIAEISAEGGAEHIIGKPRSSPITDALWLPNKTGLIVNAVDVKTKLPQIYYWSYPDGAERRVTNDLNDYKGLSITADGKSIVSQRTEQNRELWFMPAGDAAQARQLTIKKEQDCETVNWLTNDSLVFDADENGYYQTHNIWLLKIGDGEPQQLTKGAGDNRLPAASPDGKMIAFVSSRSGKPQIWRMNADGMLPTQITDMDYSIRRLQFAPDGRTIFFKTEIGGKGNLMRVSIDGGEVVSIGEADIYLWAISPDGEKLAYSLLDRDTQKFVVRIRPIDKDQPEKTLDIKPESCLQWSLDEESLYFTLAADDTRNIWRQSIQAAEPQQITDFDKEAIFLFALSPDGKNLAGIRIKVTFDAVSLNFDN